MIATLLFNEARLVWRHGFVAAYAVVTVVYAALLSSLPTAWADAVLPVLAWSDPVFFGFFFMGASVCLDLSQGTLRTLFSGPVGSVAYVAAKAGALSAISLASTFAIAVVSRGSGFRVLPIAIAAFAGTFLAGGMGMAMALLLGTINRFMLGALPVMLLLSLPLLSYSGFVRGGIPAVIASAAPSDGVLSLCLAAFSGPLDRGIPSVAAGMVAFAVWGLLVFAAILPPLIRRAREAA